MASRKSTKVPYSATKPVSKTIGTVRAQLLSAKGQDMNMTLASVHPIDTLLVQQLEHILDGEKALRTRYSLLDASANTPEVRMAFAQELADLKESADRLYRLMNAMEFYGPLPTTETAYVSTAVS
jgi:spore coat protein CotF